MITFDEAVHILKEHLGYDAKLAAKVLGSAMHSGSVGYSSQPIQTSDDSTTIITGQPPSSSSLVHGNRTRRRHEATVRHSLEF
jgi:hypothetical protein